MSSNRLRKNYLVVGLWVLAAFLSACQTADRRVAQPVVAAPDATFVGPHREGIEEVLSLARAGEWDDARVHSSALFALDPNDPSIQRVHAWVETEYERQRQRRLESGIRRSTEPESRFNPTLQSVLTEPRQRGLPMASTTRRAFEDFKSRPLVPESYNRVITRQGDLFDHRSQRGRMEDALDKHVTIQLDDVPLERIIFTVGEAEGINFIADRNLPAFQRRLSVQMRDAKLSEFLDYVSRNMEINFQIGDDVIWIVDGNDSQNRLEETRFYRLRKGFIVPAQFGAHEVKRVTQRRDNVTTETETQQMEQFVRDGAADQPSIEQAIARFFTGSDFMIDYERNVIVARGTRQELALLERIIEEFDRPVQQVLIEARFLTVTEAAFLQLGTTWETGRDAVDRRTPTDFTGFGTEVGLGLQETFTNIFSRENLSITLAALEQSGESETLSAPRLTVVNNRPARITDGKTQYYYEEYTVSQTILERRSSSTLVPKGKPTKLVSGVTLEVLASIGGDGQTILLALAPRVSQDVELVSFAEIRDRDETGQLVSSFDIRLPESRDQELATRVAVRSGETVMMGGVMERDRSTFVESVPLLGNIPVLGAAFRKRTEFDQPRYLLIFVTATLISESGEFLVIAP